LAFPLAAPIIHFPPLWHKGEIKKESACADAVKAELRGKECVMQDFNAPHKLGEAVPDLIGENGLPVVKALTDELIDELGPKILSLFFIFSSFGFCSRGHFPVSANRMLKVHMYRCRYDDRSVSERPRRLAGQRR